MRRHIPVLIVFVLLVSGCTFFQPPTPKHAENATEVTLVPVGFAELPGWNEDEAESALIAFRKSCDILMKRNPETPVAPKEIAGVVANWAGACAMIPDDVTAAHAFFEAAFTPYRLETPLGREGLFTGYYEAELRGAREKTDVCNVPLYKRPDDLVMVELGEFRDHLKGERIAGRVVSGKLKPYEDRAAIEDGALEGKGLEIAWVDDATAAFFLHIQGSGRVKLEDGSEIRVGYDGQNGHVYHAIGRELIARGELTPETTNLQSIRDWLKAHPEEAPALRQKNPSYIFFRVLEGDGPLGAQGAALTPTRSLAVDPRFVPYGAPVFLDVPHPVFPERRIQRLMIAQDTGGAIRGPVRGDFFWGSGAAAEEAAGYMKSRGPMWLLLPKAVTPAAKIELPKKK